MRYLVDDAGKLERVRMAIDQHHGYRDRRGRPVRAVHTVMRGGEVVAMVDSVEFCERLGVEPSSMTDPVIHGGDGSCALELPPTAEINACLGRTLLGVDMPSAERLVAEEELPRGVRDVLLSRRIREAVENGMDITQVSGRR